MVGVMVGVAGKVLVCGRRVDEGGVGDDQFFNGAGCKGCEEGAS